MPQPLDVVLVFSGDASKATQAIEQLNKRITRLTAAVNNMSKRTQTTSNQGASAIQKFNAGFVQMGHSIKNVTDGFRLMSQGVMSMGRALTFFVAIPLALFLRQGAEEAMSFQDAMIRVQKTATLTHGQLLEVTEGIRAIARSAPTSHQELGVMAEQAGQLGITAPKAITEFVRWMEILSTSTNIAADEVAQTMGKIAAAFGWNVNESVDEVVRLANVMNVLENTTASTAGEIATSLFTLGPQAAQLNITAADTAALSAALISLGTSAESTGTRLTNMFVKMTQNADKFADLAKGTEKYAEKADVLNAINEDAVAVMFDLIQMMHDTDNRAEALAAAFDLLNIRGGKALGPLVQNQELLNGALERARREWEESESLIREYNLALTSAQNHTKILKNNLVDVGIEFGNTILPALNDLIEFAVPALRMLGEVVRSASRETKLLAAAIAIGVVVLGPLLFLVSQIGFGFFMMALGAMKIVTGIFAAIKAVTLFTGALTILGSGPIGAILAVIAALFLLTRVFKGVSQKASDFFRDLAARAASWGENLAAEIGTGLIAGATKFIVQALVFIGNLIAKFLEAKSPPELGPLSHIDRWGKALIDTYLKSMALADFSVLNSVGRAIGNILKNFALVGKFGEDRQFVFLLEARQNLAKFLAIWRETGKISEKVLDDIVANLGEAADEIKRLIRLNIKLVEAEQALQNLQRRREDFIDSMKEEIKAAALSGKSAEERVAIIRRLLRERDAGLRALNEEEESLEEQRDLAQEQLDLQRAMVEAMQEQDDIQARLIRALDKLSETVAGGGGEFEFPEIEPGDLGEKLQDALDAIPSPIVELELSFKSKRGVWEGLLAGLRGEDFTGLREMAVAEIFGVQAEDLDMFYEFNEIGLSIRDKIDEIRQKFDLVRETIKGIREELGGAQEDIGTWADENSELLDTVKAIAGGLATFLVLTKVVAIIASIAAFAGTISGIIGSVGAFFSLIAGAGSAAGVLAVFVAAFGAIPVIIAVIAIAVAVLIKYWDDAVESFKMLVVIVVGGLVLLGRRIRNWVLKTGEAFGEWSSDIDERFSRFWANAPERIRKWLDDISKRFVAWIGETGETFAAWWADFGLFWGRKFVDLKENAATKMQALGVAIRGKAEQARDWVLEKIEELLDKGREKWDNLKTEWNKKVDAIRDDIVDKISSVKDRLLETISDWVTLGKSLVQGIIDGFWENSTTLVSNLKQLVIKAILAAGNLVGIDLSPFFNLGGGDEEGAGVAKGGIVARHSFGHIAELEPEAVIPLSKVPTIFAEILGMESEGLGERKVEVNFNNATVRSEQDLQRIIREVRRAIGEDVRRAVELGGAPRF